MLMVFGDINEARWELINSEDGSLYASQVSDEVSIGLEELLDLGEVSVEIVRDPQGVYTSKYTITNKFKK